MIFIRKCQELAFNTLALHCGKSGDALLYRASELCVAVGSDGLRGELTLMRAARALAALQAAPETTLDHLRQVAVPALRHRLRRNPLDDTGSGERIERAVADLWA